MANQYIRYGSGGSGSGVQTYANLAAFPATASDGTLAIALDTHIVYMYDSGLAAWKPIGSESTIFGIGTIDSVAASNDGAAISSNNLIMQSASATKPGLVNLAAQSFAGVKTFGSSPVFPGLKLNGGSSGQLTVATPAAITSYTITLPAAQGAADTFLKNDGSGGLSWAAGSGGGGVTSIGTIDSQTANADALTIVGTTLYAQSASGTNPGMVNTGTQTLAGNKTFSGTVGASNLSGTNTGDQTIALTGDVTGTGTGSFAATIGATKVTNAKLATMADQTFKGNISGGAAVPSDLTVTQVQSALGIATTGSPLPLNKGGTGISAASANAAFNVLSPMTTIGDLIYGGASGAGTRVAGNTTLTKKFLNQTGDGVNSAAPTWAALVSGDIPNNAADTSGTAANVSGTVAINHGGTGQTTQAAGYDALSPLTTLGDTVYGGASGTGTRLAGNTTTTKKFLNQTGDAVNSAAPAWAAIAAADLPTITLTGDVTGAASGGSVATTIGNNKVTNAMIRQSAALAVVGNSTNSTANVADIAAGADNNILRRSGTAIGFGSIDLSTSGAVGSSVLPIANGGTALATAGTDGQVVKSMNSVFINSKYYSNNINYVGNAFAETNTSGWSVSAELQNPTITNASPAVLTRTSTTGFYVGMPISLSTTGALPTGLAVNTVYYVSSVVSATQYQVSATLGGASINTSTNGSGTHTDRPGVPCTGNINTVSGLAFSRNTSSPIMGSADFKLAQSNSTNVMGQGALYAFTIDSAFQGSVMSIQMQYNADSNFTASSGQTGSLSDLTAWVYDVTNAVLIPVTPAVVTANGTNSNTFKGTFQAASNSTSYRFVWHGSTINTPATGFNFRWVNIYIGPQPVVLGPAVTDWVTYTPTFTGFGTVSAVSFFSRRVGGVLEVKGKFTCGTNTATQARITTGFNGVSANVTIDTAANPPTTIIGAAGQTGVAATYFGLYPITPSANQTYINLGIQGSATSALTAINGNDVGNSATISVDYAVAIVGWSSNTLMSNDASTRVVIARLSGDPASASANNPVIFPTVDFDTLGAYNASTGRFTAPVSGFYKVYGYINSANASLEMNAFVNAVSVITLGATDSNGESTYNGTVNVRAGDLIDVRPTGTLNANTGSTLHFEQVLGPSAIAASDKIFLQYTGNAGGSVTANVTNIDFATKVVDSSGAWSGTTFTTPRAGFYNIQGAVLVTAAGTQGIFLYVNSVQKLLVSGSDASSVVRGLSGSVYLLAGDVVSFRSDATKTLSNSASSHWLSISSQG